jgi:hypothetical protein
VGSTRGRASRNEAIRLPVKTIDFLGKKLNPKAVSTASHNKEYMKTTVLACCSLLLTLGAFAQTPAPAAPGFPPTATPFASPAPTAAILPPATAIPAPTVPMPAMPAVTATPVATATATPSNSVTLTVTSSSTPSADDEIDNAIERKIRKHFDFTTSRHHSSDSDDDTAWMAVPIVFIVFMAIFGMPVLIVAVILYFSFSKNRAMHKTVRMMVEKGQPVPESLLNPPPIVRQRSDLRRGIKWMLVGLGLMIFFGACNDWEGGAWSLGIIPFLIGAGYLIFWRLDISKEPVVREAAPPVIREDSSPKV